MDNVHYAITYNTGFRPQGGQISTHYTIYTEEGQLYRLITYGRKQAFAHKGGYIAKHYTIYTGGATAIDIR